MLLTCLFFEREGVTIMKAHTQFTIMKLLILLDIEALIVYTLWSSNANFWII
jgi:hypothetical protein